MLSIAISPVLIHELSDLKQREVKGPEVNMAAGVFKLIISCIFQSQLTKGWIKFHLAENLRLYDFILCIVPTAGIIQQSSTFSLLLYLSKSIYFSLVTKYIFNPLYL